LQGNTFMTLRRTGAEDFEAAAALVGEGHALVERERVPLSDELAERLTPPKDTAALPEAARLNVLRRLARAARRQGRFQLAAQKYSQA
jgi:hypothetical protein